ncbi:hypothetical protein TWF106_008440 [Orbilia oligospora]|uniref:Uncharacterized protein n=1 Tax=Orbilia oligospora TaxID=2813651 RepID=A0A6G1LVM2_ORBOL|nr:hypothetical protein TWF788_002613 [Orbilia oligospora]KAF3214043.1 hypothetical protein TWF191_009866 [Orbilia oligospora]KAF3222547.1 hypothetical protein TWF679_006017 [Orbilia oligospora]KAF3228037.1 hypothetical protein TWF106_008440 [Orbilia oligospora]KAF3234342.1 hypothetical protein TWF192_001575 [Orbilia oligospora]
MSSNPLDSTIESLFLELPLCLQHVASKWLDMESKFYSSISSRPGIASEVKSAELVNVTEGKEEARRETGGGSRRWGVSLDIPWKGYRPTSIAFVAAALSCNPMSLFASKSPRNAYATGNIEQRRIEATYSRHDIENNDILTARKWSR